MKPTKSIASSLMVLTALSAYGWGQKGHDTTAFIAETHLTEATKAAVDSLFDGKSIVYWANWLDNASHTPEYAYSKTWHYKNIDEGQTVESAPLHKDGDIVRAIEAQTAVLTDPSTSKEEKALALKMVVHFLGDIHQPLHTGHASDIGGNHWYVYYFGKNTNLHSVWDSSLPESAHKWSYEEWQHQIDRATPEETAQILNGGNPKTWAGESFDICASIYTLTPQDTKISYDYIAQWAPTVEQQFLKGGLRLADLLNSIFDPGYEPRNTLVTRK